jgi:hypothetical protein
MPQDPKKEQTKKSVEPSPGFLSRWFGSEKFSPEQEEGIRIAKKEMPNMAPVQPYGMFSRIAQPSALAYVSGGSNIYLSPSTNVGQSPQEIADTLTHEQTHINQKSAHSPSINIIRSFLGMDNPSEPYQRRPDELAAYQAEKDRRARMGRTPSAFPSFSTGEMYAPHDVYLPNEKKKVLTPQSPVTMR